MFTHYAFAATLTIVVALIFPSAGMGQTAEDSKMLPVNGQPNGIQLYRYFAPTFSPDSYSAMVVDPIIFYQKPDDLFTNPEALRQVVDRGLVNEVQKRFRITTQRYQGTARLTVAITAAIRTDDRQMNVYPVSSL